MTESTDSPASFTGCFAKVLEPPLIDQESSSLSFCCCPPHTLNNKSDFFVEADVLFFHSKNDVDKLKIGEWKNPFWKIHGKPSCLTSMVHGADLRRTVQKCSKMFEDATCWSDLATFMALGHPLSVLQASQAFQFSSSVSYSESLWALAPAL